MESMDRTLGFLLHDVARLLRRRFEQNARQLGLTRAQWQVLAYLSKMEGCQQSTLAEVLDLDPISVGRMVDRLESSGLVRREAHPKDRRIRLLFLEPRAHPLLEAIKEIGTQTREEALVGINSEQLELFFELLITMKSNLAALASSKDLRTNHG